MCWKSRKKPIRIIAKQDIHVFKLTEVLDDGSIAPYYHRQGDLRYEEDTKYQAAAEIYALWNGDFKEYQVFQAFHSYALCNIRLKASYCIMSGCVVPCVDIMTEKTTPMSNDVIYSSPRYTSTKLAVMLCTIPEGTDFCVNEVGEVVSSYLKVEHIIKMPFEVNKNLKTSVRSVERVNKILDNWEKGKYDAKRN